MKTPGPIGLIGAGNVTRSAVSRLPQLAERLGPVKASSFRVASRIANKLRAGHAVYSEVAFETCGLVLVCVPDSKLLQTLCDLESTHIDWKHRTVVLCDSRQDSAALSRFADRGAHTVSLMLVADVVIVEGHRSAVRELRRTLHLPARRIVELAPGAKPLFLAGLTIASHTTVLASTASDCLRAAGVPASQSRAVVRTVMNEAVHACTKAGHGAPSQHWDSEQWRSVRRQLAALHRGNPALAGFFSLLLFTTMLPAGETSAAQHPS